MWVPGTRKVAQCVDRDEVAVADVSEWYMMSDLSIWVSGMMMSSKGPVRVRSDGSGPEITWVAGAYALEPRGVLKLGFGGPSYKQWKIWPSLSIVSPP